MSVSLSKILTCHLVQLDLLKYEFITDVLKETFMKTFKPLPPVYLLKLRYCSERLYS